MRHLPHQFHRVQAGPDESRRYRGAMFELSQWRLRLRQRARQADDAHPGHQPVRHLPYQRLCRLVAVGDEPYRPDPVLDLPQWRLPVAKRPDEADDAHCDHGAMLDLPQFAATLGDWQLQPYDGGAGGGWALLDLP